MIYLDTENIQDTLINSICIVYIFVYIFGRLLSLIAQVFFPH
jgi:hypothetical protein